MYFKCHLAAEGEVVAERHHLSLSEMAALRKTHFLSPCTLLDGLNITTELRDEYRRGKEADRGGGGETGRRGWK